MLWSLRDTKSWRFSNRQIWMIPIFGVTLVSEKIRESKVRALGGKVAPSIRGRTKEY
jgi:hypothetical protein